MARTAPSASTNHPPQQLRHLSAKVTIPEPGRYRAQVTGPGPRYRDIAADLRRRIQAGEFPVELPPEGRLRDYYGISQNTLRPAILQLEAEGYLHRRQGAQHRVTAQPERILVVVDAPGDVEVEAGPATDAEREQLGLPVGAYVLRVYDLTMLDVNGDPLLWQVKPAATTRLRIHRPNAD